MSQRNHLEVKEHYLKVSVYSQERTVSQIPAEWCGFIGPLRKIKSQRKAQNTISHETQQCHEVTEHSTKLGK